MRVLCVAAHPDDEVLGVGGTILRHVDAGDEVRVVITTPCREGSTAESHEAERRMGVTYLRFPPLTTDAIVEAYRPDIVYTHSAADLNADHRTLHERVLVACRPQSGVKSIRCFDTASSTEWGMTPFRPSLFVDIAATLERKLHAMLAYASELRPAPHPRDIEALQARAAYWGQMSGFTYAEPFEVARERW